MLVDKGKIRILERYDDPRVPEIPNEKPNDARRDGEDYPNCEDPDDPKQDGKNGRNEPPSIRKESIDLSEQGH